MRKPKSKSLACEPYPKALAYDPEQWPEETAITILVRGGTVVNHDDSKRCNVLINGEAIVAIR